MSHISFISVHDVFQSSKPVAPFNEGVVICAYLSSNSLPCLTSTPAKDKWVYDQIMKIKKELDIQEHISESCINPSVFFNNEQTGRRSKSAKESNQTISNTASQMVSLTDSPLKINSVVFAH